MILIILVILWFLFTKIRDKNRRDSYAPGEAADSEDVTQNYEYNANNNNNVENEENELKGQEQRGTDKAQVIKEL